MESCHDGWEKARKLGGDWELRVQNILHIYMDYWNYSTKIMSSARRSIMVFYDSVLMEVSFQLSGNELSAKTGRSLLQVWLWMFGSCCPEYRNSLKKGPQSSPFHSSGHNPMQEYQSYPMFVSSFFRFVSWQTISPTLWTKRLVSGRNLNLTIPCPGPHRLVPSSAP